MIHNCILFFFFLFILTPIISGKTIDVHELWESTKQNSYSLKLSSELIQQQDFQILSTKSFLYPDVSLVGSAQHNGNLTKTNFGGKTIQFQPDETYRAAIQTNYSIFNGNRTKALLNTHQQLRKNLTFNRELQESEILYQLLITYLDWMNSIQMEELATQVFQSAVQHKKLTEEKYLTGFISSLEVTRANVQVELMQVNYENALANRKIQQQRLAGITYFPIDSTDIPNRNFLDVSKVRVTHHWFDELPPTNQELTLLKSQITLADLQRKQSTREYYPFINLFGNYSIANGSDPFDAMMFKGQWTIGVQLSQPLFQGFRTKWTIEENQSFIRQKQLQYNFASHSIQTELNILDIKLRTSQQKIDLHIHFLYQAEEALRTTETLFQQGQATSTEVSDALLELQRSRQNRYQSIYEYQLVLLEVYHLTGRLYELIGSN